MISLQTYLKFNPCLTFFTGINKHYALDNLLLKLHSLAKHAHAT